MKNATWCALILFLLVLTGGAAIVTRDLHHVLVESSVAVDHAGTVVAKVSTAADTLNAAASEERKNWAATSKEAAKTGRALRMLISRVDRNFVDGTLQHVNDKTLPAIDAQIETNGAQLSRTIAKLGETADGMTAATSALNLRLNDPQIPEILGQLNLATAQLAQASGHANKILADGEVVADHYEAVVMKPVSFARRAGEYLLSFGADARVLFTGGK